MTVLFTIILSLLTVQFLFVVWNVRHYPTLEGAVEAHLPTVSVLIPARNEAHNLLGLLQSLVQQSLRPLEVIVLDDQSTDETANVVRAFSKKYAWITVVEGKPLPVGWLGKCFACHQLSQQARGKWLLFLDADVRLEKEALKHALEEASRQRTGIITGFPKQIVGSWLERLVVPLMVLTIACHLPIRLVRRSQNPQFVAAHGGFMFIEKMCYQRVGGHEAIKQDLVDDMALAKHVKRNEYPVTLAKIDKWVSMRMYTQAKEVFHGYQKNIFVGVNRNVFLLTGVLGYYFLLFIFPFLFFVVTLLGGSPSGLAVCAVLIGMCLKGFIDSVHGQPFWYGVLLPFSFIALTIIAIASVYGGVSKRGYEWKGRRYS